MINLTKVIRIDFGVAPFTHSWSLTDPCITVLSSEIKVENGDNILYTTFEAYDENCINNNKIATLHLEDSATIPCKRDFAIELSSPCGTTEFLYNTGIVRTDSLVFTAPVNKINAPYTYEWTFNDTLFEEVEKKDDSITLKLKERVYVKDSLQSSISVKIYDKNNCLLQNEFIFSLAAPTVGEEVTFDTVCDVDKTLTTNTITLPITPAFAEIQDCFVEPCNSDITVETICTADSKAVKVSGLNPGCVVTLSQDGLVQRTVTANINGNADFLQLLPGVYQIDSVCTDCAFDEDIYLCTDNNSKFKEIPINWNSLELLTPNGVTWTNLLNGKIEVQFDEIYSDEKLKITYFVEDINGVRVQGELCVQVTNCNDDFLLPDIQNIIGCTDCQQRIADGIIQADAELCNDSNIVISLEDRLKNLNVDWSTLEFVPADGQIFGNDTLAGINNFTALIDRNRNLVISPTNPTFGTQFFQENIRFRAQSNNGQIAYFNVEIEKESCDGEAIPIDDSICLNAGASILNYDVTANDQNVATVESFTITKFPAATLGNFTFNNRGKISVVAASTADGVYTAKYRVNDSLLEGTITITVNNNNETNYAASYCNVETAMIDLYPLLVDVEDTSGYWVYRGKKTFLTDLNFAAGTIKIQDEPYTSYLPNAKLTTSGTFNLTVGLEQDLGFHHFAYVLGESPCTKEHTIIIESVAPVSLPDPYTHNVCVDEAEFNINNITYNDTTLGEVLPDGGVWFNTVPGTLTGEMFFPIIHGPGTYTWTYTVPNQGEYNTVCDSIFELNIFVDAVVYAGEDTCTKVCSDGPAEGDPGFACRLEGDIKKEYAGDDTCVICLRDKLNTNPDLTLNTDGKWVLVGAPYSTNVPLYINGQVYFLDVYDPNKTNQKEEDYTLPGSNPCIDFSHLDLGDYTFEYQVGDICTDTALFIVSVFPSPCEIADIEATFCGTRPPITLYNLLLELLPEGETCIPSINGNWEDVSLVPLNPGVLSLSQDDDGTNDLITPELVLPADAEVGDDRTVSLIYRYFPDFAAPSSCTAESCDPDCESCVKEVRLDLLFSKSAEQGTARNLTTCNGEGDCLINLFSRVIDGQTGGEWYYVGCNGLSKDAVDPDCNIGLVIDSVTRFPSRDVSIGDDTLGIDFSDATIAFYFFEYVSCNDDGCCTTTPLTIQVVDLLNPGEDNTCDLCVDPDNPVCVNLFVTLNGTPYQGGTWENTNNSATVAQAGCVSDVQCGQVTTNVNGGFYSDSAGDGTNASFNTKDQARGTHIFEYTVYDPPAEFEIDKGLCPSCTAPTATVTINLDDGTCIGGGRNLSICDDSCPIQLFDRLDPCVGDTNVDLRGGTWTYDGCNPVSSTAPDGGCVEAVALTYPAGRPLWDPLVDLDGKPVGFYFFTYTLCNPDGNCCSTQQIVIEVIEELCAGGDDTCTVCNQDPECIDLFAQLAVNSACGVVDTGGTWENLDGAPIAGAACTGNGTPLNCGEETATGAGGFFDIAAGNPGSTQATFNSDGVAPGTYRFRYTVNTQGSMYEYNPEGCINCLEGSAVITIIVQEPESPGDPDGINVCNS